MLRPASVFIAGLVYIPSHTTWMHGCHCEIRRALWVRPATVSSLAISTNRQQPTCTQDCRNKKTPSRNCWNTLGNLAGTGKTIPGKGSATGTKHTKTGTTNTIPYIALHCMELHHNTLHYIALALCYINCIALHHVSLQCIALCIT